MAAQIIPFLSAVAARGGPAAMRAQRLRGPFEQLLELMYQRDQDMGVVLPRPRTVDLGNRTKTFEPGEVFSHIRQGGAPVVPPGPQYPSDIFGTMTGFEPPEPAPSQPAAPSAEPVAPPTAEPAPSSATPSDAPIQPMRVKDPADTTLEPHKRAFLNALARGESAGAYNVRYTPKGGAYFNDLSKHPAIFEPGPEGRSSAAGRYQFTKTTWDRLGGGPMTPELQDRRAWQLAEQDFQARTGKDLDKHLQEKGFDAEVARALSPTWTSLRGGRTRAMREYNASYDRYAGEAGIPIRQGKAVGPGSIPEKGLRVATLRPDGTVAIGQPTDIHATVSGPKPGPGLPGSDTLPTYGYVTPDGRFLNRVEAMKWVQEKEKAGYKDYGNALESHKYRTFVGPERRAGPEKPAAEVIPLAAVKRGEIMDEDRYQQTLTENMFRDFGVAIEPRPPAAGGAFQSEYIRFTKPHSSIQNGAWLSNGQTGRGVLRFHTRENELYEIPAESRMDALEILRQIVDIPDPGPAVFRQIADEQAEAMGIGLPHEALLNPDGNPPPAGPPVPVQPGPRSDIPAPFETAMMVDPGWQQVPVQGGFASRLPRANVTGRTPIHPPDIVQPPQEGEVFQEGGGVVPGQDMLDPSYQDQPRTPEYRRPFDTLPQEPASGPLPDGRLPEPVLAEFLQELLRDPTSLA